MVSFDFEIYAGDKNKEFLSVIETASKIIFLASPA